MSKNQFIKLGIALIILGTIVMWLLNSYEHGQLIGGLIIGAGGGCLAVITAPKNSKTD